MLKKLFVFYIRELFDCSDTVCTAGGVFSPQTHTYNTRVLFSPPFFHGIEPVFTATPSMLPWLLSFTEATWGLMVSAPARGEIVRCAGRSLKGLIRGLSEDESTVTLEEKTYVLLPEVKCETLDQARTSSPSPISKVSLIKKKTEHSVIFSFHYLNSLLYWPVYFNAMSVKLRLFQPWTGFSFSIQHWNTRSKSILFKSYIVSNNM